MTYIKTQKDIVRAKYKELRRKLDPELKASYEEKICSLIRGLASYRYADVLLTYSPLKYELNLNALADDAIACGKRVAFPRCNPQDRSMKFLYITDRSQLSASSMKILEPYEGLPEYDVSGTERAICIVPAITYDADGYRIGYGKGYYDRFLKEFSGTKVGVAVKELLIDRVPRGRFDIPVDVLVTEKGVKAFYEN